VTLEYKSNRRDSIAYKDPGQEVRNKNAYEKIKVRIRQTLLS